MLGTYSSGFVADFSCSAAVPAMNSPLQPSDTQMPVSSYPQLFPRRHGADPEELTIATPDDVSAAQCVRAPGFDSHEIRSETGGPAAAGVSCA